MIRSVRRTIHPGWYQGYGKRAPYFEGWYYKLVDASEQHRVAVIPGIFKGKDPTRSHSFVQILDGSSGEATYHRYPTEAFQAARQGLEIRVGPNCFGLDRVSLKIHTVDWSLAGDLQLSSLTPWPSTILSPGAMGVFAWIPFLQTYHGVVSFDHVIHGTLALGARTLDFSDGRGYIEKDWGRSFPDAWIWMQTNHFERPGISFTASVATIPWLLFSFRGFLVGLWHEGDLYRFATYTGAQIDELAIDEEDVRIVISDGEHRLEVIAHRAESSDLRGPTGLDMGGRVPESLQATVRVRLSRKRQDGSKLVFEGTGRHAGLEVVGSVSRLLEEQRSSV